MTCPTTGPGPTGTLRCCWDTDHDPDGASHVYAASSVSDGHDASEDRAEVERG